MNYYYGILKPQFGPRVGLLYTDTDSLVLKIFSNNLVGELKEISDWHDFSNKHEADPLHDGTKLGLTGYFKDENGSGILFEYMGVRTKCYLLEVEPYYRDVLSFKTSKTLHCKVKGAPIRNQISHLKDLFVNTLKTDEPSRIAFSRLAGHNRQMMMEATSRKAIATFCDKV